MSTVRSPTTPPKTTREVKVRESRERDSLTLTSCVVLGGVVGDLTVLTSPQHPLRLTLELADALPGDAELLAKLRKCGGILLIETVAPDQDVPVALGESLYGLAKLGRLHLQHYSTGRVRGPLVLDELAEFGAVVVGGEGLI